MNRTVIALLLCCAVNTGARAQSTVGDAEFQSQFQFAWLGIETGQQCRKMKIWLATDRKQRARGLMFVHSMPADNGMLFVYPVTVEMSMWMKNTVIPLDIVFMDADGKILNIARDTTPFSLSSIPAHGPAQYVLELNAGVAAELGLSDGQTLFRPDLL